MKSKSMGFEWIGRIKQFEGIFAVLRAIGNHVRNLKKREKQLLRSVTFSVTLNVQMVPNRATHPI